MASSRRRDPKGRSSRTRRLLQGALGAGATLAALAALAVGLALAAYGLPGPAARTGASTTVVLRRGAGVSEVAGDLARAGVVRSSALFIAAAELTRAAPRLKAGEYAFPTRSSLARVIDKLRSGDIVHHRITIPEGLTSAQAVAILNASDLLVGQVPTPPEGAILPDTYEVTRGEQRASVLQAMMDERDEVVNALWARRRPNLVVRTLDEAVTLASIVEKETAVPGERPRIAAVYANRLRQGMRLQADPTVIYAVTGGAPLGHGLTMAELGVESPYNTYRNPGLPPGPIGNPGRAALAAVMDPPATADLYFVADGTGGHAFAATLEDHARNVARWRQIEKSRGAARRPAPSRAG